MVLITGATGTVGRELVKQLHAAKAQFRVALQSPQKVARAKSEGEDATILDYETPQTFGPALDGIEKLFLLSPPGRTALEAPLIDAAKKTGVKHLVKLSVYGAPGEDFLFGREHRAMEKKIEASGVPYTFVRPNGFMQNYVSNFGATIKQQGAFYLPARDSRYSMIDVRDIAAVSVAVLTSNSHVGRAYTLTGPEALGNSEVAGKLSHAMGKEVKYVAISDDDFRQAVGSAGVPAAMSEAVLDLMHYYISGKAARVTNDVEKVIGRKPNSFDQFARDHVQAFC
jgi:uncharacterized protein YbjT (DUF2867 family)